MAQYKFTIQRGKRELKDIAVAAGTAEAQSDTISINIDVTKLTKGEAAVMIDQARDKLLSGKWPPI